MDFSWQKPKTLSYLPKWLNGNGRIIPVLDRILDFGLIFIYYWMEFSDFSLRTNTYQWAISSYDHDVCLRHNYEAHIYFYYYASCFLVSDANL